MIGRWRAKDGVAPGSASCILVSILALGGMSCNAAAAATAVNFDIAPQALTQALVDFAIQGNVSIGLGDSNIGGQRSSGFRQSARPEDALSALLKGTGLTFRAVGASSFLVERVRTAAPRDEKSTAVDPPTAVEEIVVTAAKRSEVLQHAAYSVAVASGQQLQALGSLSLHDAAPLFAGFTATNQGPGRSKFFVRGLSDGAFAGQTQTVVGLYLDDTRITFNEPDPSLELVDIDRVEVVRGPQGTLYGAGAIGGLVRIITVQPDFDRVEARGGVESAQTDGGDRSYAAQATVNAPLVPGRLAVRGSIYGRHLGGYIDDVGLAKDNVNDTNITGGRLTLAARVFDGWTIEGGAVVQGIDSRDTQYFDRAKPRYTRANAAAEPHDNDFRRFHVQVRGELDWARVESSTAWVRHTVESRFDASLALPQLAGLPVQTAIFDQDSRQTTVNHETRFVSNTVGRFDWLAGIFASHRDQVSESLLTVPGRSSGLTAPYSDRRSDDGDEFAAFGEASYHLSAETTATLGLRWFHGVLDTRSVASGTAVLGPPEAVGHNAHAGFTPKLVLSHEWGQDGLVYAEASKGFRLGGINIGSALPATAGSDDGDEDGVSRTVTNFASDTLWSYELGMKKSWLDDKLIVNAASFYAVWKNIQADQVRANGLPYTANIGTAHNKGLEVDAQARPTARLTLSANFTLNMPELTASNSLALGHSDRLPVVPRFSGALLAGYRMTLPGDIEGALTVSYSLVGKSRLNFGADAGPAMGGYQLAAARMTFNRGPWTATVFAHNLGNARANTFAFGNPFSLRQIQQVTPPTPRTIGVRLDWAY